MSVDSRMWKTDNHNTLYRCWRNTVVIRFSRFRSFEYYPDNTIRTVISKTIDRGE